ERTIAEEGDPFVQSWNDLVPVAHRERAAAQEVVLHVDQEERITPAHRFRTVPHRLLSSGYTRPWVHTRPVARSGGAAYVEGACARWCLRHQAARCAPRTARCRASAATRCFSAFAPAACAGPISTCATASCPIPRCRSCSATRSSPRSRTSGLGSRSCIAA